MKTTDDKLEQLRQDYCGVDQDALMEVLLSCDGSVAEVRKLLDQSLNRKSQTKHQMTLNQFVKKPNEGSKVSKPLGRTSVKPSMLLEIPLEKSRKSQTKIITLHDEQLVNQLHPYVSLHKDFFPYKLSNDLLKYLLDNTDNFTVKKFYLFDQWCQSNHKLGFIRAKDYTRTNGMYYNGVKGEASVYDDNMTIASQLINRFINEDIIPKYPRLPFQAKEEFTAAGCVVNYYSEMSKNLDWHSDRLQDMGPQNFIASVSLGATREFRMRRISQPNIIYSIPVSHNSLLIMHPGCQELFKHCVNPMRKPIQLNTISGSTRFNLTFRHFPQSFIENTPTCKCNIPMVLRRSYKLEIKLHFGRYHWTCENAYQNKDCHTFHWADFNNKHNHFISESEDSISTWAVK